MALLRRACIFLHFLDKDLFLLALSPSFPWPSMTTKGQERVAWWLRGRCSTLSVRAIVVLLLLLLLPSVANAFRLLPPSRVRSSGGLRATTNLGPSPVEPPISPFASHSIDTGFRGLFCSKCGETSNFKTTCVPAAAERAAAAARDEINRAVAAARDEKNCAAAAADAHALDLVKVNVTHTDTDTDTDVYATTTLLVACLTLVSLLLCSRGVAAWVKLVDTPLRRTAKDKLSTALVGVTFFLLGKCLR